MEKQIEKIEILAKQISARRWAFYHNDNLTFTTHLGRKGRDRHIRWLQRRLGDEFRLKIVSLPWPL